MDKETIKNVFDELLDNHTSKCMSLDRIREKLGEMSQEEKNIALKDKLNPGEQEWYEGIIDRLNSAKRNLEHYSQKLEEYDGDDDSIISRYESEIHRHEFRVGMFEEYAFGYEKRIYNNYKQKKPKEPQDLTGDYNQEEQIKFMGDNEIGEIEQKLIDRQSQVNFTEQSSNSLTDYFNDGYVDLNARLWDSEDWRSYNNDYKKSVTPKLDKMEKGISDAFRNVEPIGEPLIVYHGGEFDISKVVGDKITMKGYTSASFQMNVAKEFHNYTSVVEEMYYKYEFLLPSSAKGICANDKSHGSLSKHTTEQELLLNKGLSGDIVNIDYENHVVTVKVDG